MSNFPVLQERYAKLMPACPPNFWLSQDETRVLDYGVGQQIVRTSSRADFSRLSALCLRLKPHLRFKPITGQLNRLYTSLCLSALVLAGCSSTPPVPVAPAPSDNRPAQLRFEDQQHANEIVLQAMSLLETNYQFGGRNPEAGLDCSGMVSLVVEKATGRRLPHNAAQIAAQTREVRRKDLKPADLVFFNTNGKPYSHMGIYLGDGRFVHAPSTRGKVRIERLDMAYYAQRFTGARSLFD